MKQETKELQTHMLTLRKKQCHFRNSRANYDYFTVSKTQASIRHFIVFELASYVCVNLCLCLCNCRKFVFYDIYK